MPCGIISHYTVRQSFKPSHGCYKCTYLRTVHTKWPVLFSPCVQVYFTGTKTTVVAGFEPVSGTLDTSGPETEIVVKDLIPDTVYIFSIAAVNGAGEGERSTQLETTTLVGPPPVVREPDTDVEPLGGTRTYTLGIARPSNINGPIRCVHSHSRDLKLGLGLCLLHFDLRSIACMI